MSVGGEFKWGIEMNVAYSFFIAHGMSKNLDKRTIENMLDEVWVSHAKSGCMNDDEEKYIDQCVQFQKSRLN